MMIGSVEWRHAGSQKVFAHLNAELEPATRQRRTAFALTPNHRDTGPSFQPPNGSAADRDGRAYEAKSNAQPSR